MATFNITATANIDSLAGKTGDDTYNINGGHLIVDQDSRYGLNNTTSATMGNMPISATLGGQLTLSARNVRIIPFNNGTGNVPAYNTTISQGSASGLLIGVYSALNVAPTTPASAMPTSGFIKIKQWNETPYSAGALTGIGADATDEDRQGWIEIVGEEGRSSTIPRLGIVNLNTNSDWFELGTTTGSNATTYQIPSNGTNVYCAGVQVETDIGSDEYEWYVATNIDALPANFGTDEFRGKVCWVSTGGLLRFQNDGTNSTGGYLPPSGRKIRIPSLILNSAQPASRTVNNLNATPTTRYRFTTASAGELIFYKTMKNWGASYITPQRIRIIESCIQQHMTVTTASNRVWFVDSCLGRNQALTATSGIVVNSTSSGLLIQNSRLFHIGTSTASHSINLNDVNNITIENSHLSRNGLRGTAYNGINLARCNQIEIFDFILGVDTINALNSTDIDIKDLHFYGSAGGRNIGTVTQNILSLNNSVGTIFDGLDFLGIEGVAPLTSIVSTTSSSANIFIKNIGSYNNPINAGWGSPVYDVPWSRVGGTVTVISPSHGLVVNDRITIILNNGSSQANYQITSVPDADTFVFTGSSSGATSGLLSYHPTIMDRIFTSTASVANLSVRNVHFVNVGNELGSFANTCQDYDLRNISVNRSYTTSAPQLSANNIRMNSVEANLNPNAVPGVSGTHFADNFNTPIYPSNTISGTWTRSGSTVTVTTATPHGLKSTSNFRIIEHDNTLTGILNQLYRVGTVNSTTEFTFIGTNSGSTSGNLTFVVADGALNLFMNEDSEQTASQVSISGGAAFTGAGSISMPTTSAEATFTMPDYIKGFDSVVDMGVDMFGGSISDYELTYQIDRGSGWSDWKNLSYARSGASGSAASTTISVDDTTGILVGDSVQGFGVDGLARVTSIDSATDITVSVANYATVSGVLRFSSLHDEATFPATGVKFKIRVKPHVNGAAAISLIRIPSFVSTNTSRARIYELALELPTFSLYQLEAGTEIVVLNSDTNTEIVRQVVSGSTFSYQYTYTGTDINAKVLVWKDDKQIILYDVILGDSNQNIPVLYSDDLIYMTDRDDSPVTFDYNNLVIEMGATTIYNVPEVYSRWKDDILIDTNALFDFAFSIVGGNPTSGANSIPPYTFLTNGWRILPQDLDHTLQVVDGILLEENQADPFLNVTGRTVRILYEQPVQAIAVSTSGGGGVTPAAVWSHANRTLTGIGSSGIASEDVLDEVLSNTDATQAKIDIL